MLRHLLKQGEAQDVLDAARRAGRELAREELYDSLMELQVLHKNFYDEAVPAPALPRLFGKTQGFLLELEELSG